jgi:hypothetical protein
MSRRDLVDRLVALAGNIVRVVDPLDGWPGLVRIRLSGGDLPAAAHLGPVGLSHRDRDDVERRFQNPGKGRPMSAPEGYLPLLLVERFHNNVSIDPRPRKLYPACRSIS